MHSTIFIDFLENNADSMFGEVYRLRSLPYKILKKDDRKLLKICDRYIEFKRIKEPTFKDREECDNDLYAILNDTNII